MGPRRFGLSSTSGSAMICAFGSPPGCCDPSAAGGVLAEVAAGSGEAPASPPASADAPPLSLRPAIEDSIAAVISSGTTHEPLLRPLLTNRQMRCEQHENHEQQRHPERALPERAEHRQDERNEQD